MRRNDTDRDTTGLGDEKRFLWRTVTLGMLVLVLLPFPGVAEDFARAVPGREFVFPQDHGKHPDFQTEWWYFTGNLRSDHNRWGFQLTFFRRALAKTRPPWRSAWTVRDVYPAHFALTDGKGERFFHTELMAREGPGLAGAAPDKLHVRVRDWSATAEDNSIRLRARQDDCDLDLRLIPVKPPVLHGNNGYSRKGISPTQASYYYSFTRLKAQGVLTVNGTSHAVDGYAWMDHEFGSSILLESQVGWDWFGIQLDDGSEIMLFYLRNKDGTRDRIFGTFVPKETSPVNLNAQDLSIEATGTWKSPHTGAVYPSGWRVRIPSLDLDLGVTPILRDQELSTGRSTSIVYWEGAVDASGVRAGAPVQGHGYVELTGYAQGMAGRL